MAQGDWVRLSGLICARICHDLVGPIGGVVNGIEFLSEDGMGDDALQLIADSAGRAARRLSFSGWRWVPAAISTNGWRQAICGRR
ncbi:hypothetical protein ACFQ4K_03065 [Tistrella bauzanensis]